MHRTAIFILIWALAAAAPISAALIREIVVDTSPLVVHVAGPFSLNFQLNDGSGSGDGDNTATLTDFMFGAGGPAGPPDLFGGASGSLSSDVTITDSEFFNSFVQQFTPGSMLRFRLMLTTNIETPVPDQFSFAVLDSSGVEIPTLALAETGSDALLVVDIEASPQVRTFATDEFRFPVAGGPPIDMAAPVVIPEPASVLLMSSGAALLLLYRTRCRVR